MSESTSSLTAVNPTLARIADALAHRRDAELMNLAKITDCVRAVKKSDGFLRGIRQTDAAKTIRELLTAQLEVRRQRRLDAPNAYLVSPLERAARRSRWLAKTTYNSRAAKYRTCEQGHETRVEIGAAGVDSKVHTGESYSSRCWYAKQTSVHTLTVPAQWCLRVRKRGLAVCDGMFTLDAVPVPGVGAELFRAVWVEQGRGTSLKLVRGYIARIGDTTYHAATAKAALDGVQRKAGQKPPRRAPVLDLDRLVRRYGTIAVSLEDSSAVGNCESGTRNWCNAVGIDLGAGSVPLADVIRGYKVRPMPEALRVIRHAVKQHREWERVLAQPRGKVRFDAEGGFRVEGD